MTTIKEHIKQLEELHPKILESDTVDDSYLETRTEMTADSVYDVMTMEVFDHDEASEVRHYILENDYESAYETLERLGL